ncbi:MAG: hypothetical protein LIO46_06425 [Clostridiales bacterium]|nr:hypothetical protein [Clostridiales bacterium]
MKKAKYFLRWGLFLPSLLISLCISLIGIYVFPVFFDFGMQEEARTPVWMGVLLFVCLAAGGILFMQVLAHGIGLLSRKRRKLFSGFGKLLGFLGILCLSGIVLSLLYGLLALLLYTVFKNSFTMEQIQGVVNILTGCITLLVLPAALYFLCRVLTQPIPLKAALRLEPKVFRRQYPKLLFTAIGLFAAGFLLMIPFQYLPQTMIAMAAKTALLSLLGMAGMIIMVSFFVGELKKESVLSQKT